MTSSDTIVVAILCIFFFSVGVVALFWPEKVQDFALKFYGNAKFLAKWNPFLNWMQTPAYLLSLRIVGASAILAGLLALYALFVKR